MIAPVDGSSSNPLPSNPERCTGPDWDPGQYLRFAGHRERAALELLNRIGADRPGQVTDLGCGPGNMTRFLLNRWPGAHLCGVDRSAAMLATARAEHPGVQWMQADAARWQPTQAQDVIYANASLHWVKDHAGLFPRLLECLAPGGWLAVQMPLSWHQPSHRLMRETLLDAGPGGAPLGSKSWRVEVSRKWVNSASWYHTLLARRVEHLDVWESRYMQVLHGQDAVLEWVRGTGLRPFLDGLSPRDAERFLHRYRERLNAAYPPGEDGVTLFPFRRLFIVARR
ncbi:MAG: methyltransferase domain-containing protein [Gammaproteobacteria bacterium]